MCDSDYPEGIAESQVFPDLEKRRQEQEDPKQGDEMLETDFDYLDKDQSR